MEFKIINVVITLRSTDKGWTLKVGAVRLQGELSGTHTTIERDV